jgi:acylphosphatase
MIKEFHAIVSGRVQMVMYRDFTQRKATSLQIVGTVRNLPNGAVEIFAQGEEEKLEKFIQKLHRGSLLAKVEHIELSWKEPLAVYDSFKIVY